MSRETSLVNYLDMLLPIAFGVVALLYASVGQAGGTGYVAVMGVLGLAPDVIKPTALALNILVAAIGCRRFYRTGCGFRRKSARHSDLKSATDSDLKPATCFDPSRPPIPI